MRSRPPPGRPRGRGEIVSTGAILGGRDREAAPADAPSVAILRSPPLPGPDVPAVFRRLQPIPLPVEAPLALELQPRQPRPLAHDLAPAAEELYVVVAGAADVSPLQQWPPAESRTLARREQ